LTDLVGEQPGGIDVVEGQPGCRGQVGRDSQHGLAEGHDGRRGEAPQSRRVDGAITGQGQHLAKLIEHGPQHLDVVGSRDDERRPSDVPQPDGDVTGRDRALVVHDGDGGLAGHQATAADPCPRVSASSAIAFGSAAAAASAAS
jgi:hypothetical protein